MRSAFSLYFSYIALTYVVVWVLCLVRWLILVCFIVSCDWVWVPCLISTVCDSPNDHRLWVLIDQNQNTIKSTHHSLICPPLFWSLLIPSCPMYPSLTSRDKIGECCVPCYHCDTLLQQKQKVWEWEISSKWSESQRALSTPQLEINSSDIYSLLSIISSYQVPCLLYHHHFSINPPWSLYTSSDDGGTMLEGIGRGSRSNTELVATICKVIMTVR